MNIDDMLENLLIAHEFYNDALRKRSDKEEDEKLNEYFKLRHEFMQKIHDGGYVEYNK